MSATATAATTTSWHIDPAHTQAEFEVKHMMFAKVRGRFATIEGQIELGSPEHPGSSSVRASIRTASIDTGTADRDAHLRSADFFNVEQYPELTFESRSVSPSTDGAFTIVGDLTIRDVTKSIKLEARETGRGVDPWGNARVGFTATTSIDRRDFGLTWNQALEAGGILVGTDVRITLEVQATKA
jgi:polyisoprenoid-binding protein YceI